MLVSRPCVRAVVVTALHASLARADGLGNKQTPRTFKSCAVSCTDVHVQPLRRARRIHLRYPRAIRKENSAAQNKSNKLIGFQKAKNQTAHNVESQ